MIFKRMVFELVIDKLVVVVGAVWYFRRFLGFVLGL